MKVHSTWKVPPFVGSLCASSLKCLPLPALSSWLALKLTASTCPVFLSALWIGTWFIGTGWTTLYRGWFCQAMSLSCAWNTENKHHQHKSGSSMSLYGLITFRVQRRRNAVWELEIMNCLLFSIFSLPSSSSFGYLMILFLYNGIVHL